MKSQFHHHHSDLHFIKHHKLVTVNETQFYQWDESCFFFPTIPQAFILYMAVKIKHQALIRCLTYTIGVHAALKLWNPTQNKYNKIFKELTNAYRKYYVKYRVVKLRLPIPISIVSSYLINKKKKSPTLFHIDSDFTNTANSGNLINKRNEFFSLSLTQFF